MPDELEQVGSLGRARGWQRQRLLADIFQRHRTRLRRMVDLRLHQRLRSRVDPSDILQEAFIEAARRLEQFLAERPMPFFVWLRQITAQRLVDVQRAHLNAKGRDARREVSLQPARAPEASTLLLTSRLMAAQPTPSEVVANAELEHRTHAAVESLDEMDREVLALRHFEELSNAETAAVLGIKTSAASKRHARALRRLRAVIETGVPHRRSD